MEENFERDGSLASAVTCRKGRRSFFVNSPVKVNIASLK